MTPTGRAVLDLEIRKLARATVTRVATIATLAIVTMTTVGGYASVRFAGDTDMGAKAADMITAPGWAGYTGLASTGIGVALTLAAGIVMAWSTGREFTDGTVVSLFAVPPSLAAIATGKIIAVLAWIVMLAAGSSVLLTAAGLALGLPLAEAPANALVIATVAALLGASVLPVMWVSTRWRGYLAGIAATLALVVVTNLAAGFGAGTYLPWAVPALWATPGSGVSGVMLLLPAAVGVLGAWLTRSSWSSLQLGAN